MTFLRLLLRNLLYHWRGNFAVFLGIALGSAVLTGALLVGDSLRGSLKALTLDQLGWVESAMLPGRFFRAALADELSLDKHSAILLLQGSVSRKDADDATQRVGKVNVLGIDASFWPKALPSDETELWSSENRAVVLNQTLASDLGAKVGDSITLHLERADAAPRETILAQRKAENVIELITVKVQRIVPDEGMGRFSLKPSPVPTRNAFVPIKLLQRQLDLTGRANAILAAGAAPKKLPEKLTLDDWGLRYLSPKDRAEAFVRFLDPKNFDDGNLRKLRWIGRVPEELAARAAKNGNILTKEMVNAYYESHRDYYALESQRMLLEPQVVKAVERLVPDLGKDPDVVPRWKLKPILIYLADSLAVDGREVPYAIIASDDQRRIGKDGKFDYALADDQIRLMRWPGALLKPKLNDAATITYYAPNEKNHLVKDAAKFTVAVVDDIDGIFDDPDLTPEFRGITDKADMASWENPPFPYDRKRITKADEEFWKRYRTTPKAYINLRKAQELWKSRFGEYTSIQFRTGQEHPKFFPEAMLKELKPEQGGFAFQPVRDQAIKASGGATDFGLYFFYFSFFLIVAALLLVGLLVRLNLDRRASEIGLLLATGWDYARLRWLLLGEGALLAFFGSLVGLGGALLYGHLMLKLLAANWPGDGTLNFLRLHAEPITFAIGFAGSFVASMATLFLAMRYMSKRSPRALLSGEATPAIAGADTKPGWSWWLMPIGVVGAVGLAISARFVTSHEGQAGCFFGGGALFLTACLAGVWHGLKASNRASSPQPTLTRLGLRNAGRHAVRSVLTVGLLASASFLIVAVESFHKDTDKSFYLHTGGSGGFAFYAEGNVPIFEDLNDPRVWRERGLDTPELRRAQFFGCRVQPGDDASCLGLYKPLKPRVMGLPKKLIERGGFAFATSQATAKSKEDANPWLLLERKDDDAIPAILDANTAQYILNVGLGETLEVNNGEGEAVKLRLVAILQDSIFQSEVLISEANFLKLYPQQTGFSFFLIDVGDTDSGKLKVAGKQLGKGLDELGLDVETTASRLQGYLAVENTYLATFQALGGLGLVLGAAGLAIVLLRGVWERRAELALLLALGFRPGQLAWLVLVENALLLALGLAAGTASALLAVAPHLIGAGAQVLWLRIAGLLAIVLAVGLVSALLAVLSTLRTPVLTALRRE